MGLSGVRKGNLDFFLLMLMELMEHFDKRAMWEDGVMLRGVISPVLTAEIHFKLGLEVMSQAIFCLAWSKFNK